MQPAVQKRGCKEWRKFAAANPEQAAFLLRHHSGEQVIAHGEEYIAVVECFKDIYEGGTGRFTIIDVP